jgi:hypothetical protein
VQLKAKYDAADGLTSLFALIRAQHCCSQSFIGPHFQSCVKKLCHIIEADSEDAPISHDISTSGPTTIADSKDVCSQQQDVGINEDRDGRFWRSPGAQ